MRLSTKLNIYSLLACVAIFIAIALMIDFYAARSEIRQAERITGLLQNEMVNNLGSRLYSVEQIVKRTSMELRDDENAHIKRNGKNILISMIESDSIIKGCAIALIPDDARGNNEWMEYANADGDSITISQLGNTGYGYTRQEWFTQPVSQHRNMWSPPYLDDGAGNCLMVTYSALLTNKAGKITGVITADVALNSIDEEAAKLIPYEGTVSFLMTKEGRILDKWPENSGLNPYIGLISDIPDRKSGEYVDKEIAIDGNKYICNYTAVKSINLIVCSATPIESIRPVTARIKFPVLLIIATGFLLLTFMLREVLKKHLRPLNNLTEAAKEVGDGKFEIDFPEMGSYTDLRQLRDAMEHMTLSLRSYIERTKETTRIQERMASELDISRSIQRSMLPAGKAEYHAHGGPGVRIAAMQESALEVGGDLYDYLDVNGIIYFIIADVSGKGIPAALMMTYIKSLFRFAAQQKLRPCDIIECLNDNMCENNVNNMFATLLIGTIDLAAEKLNLANAGHTHPILSKGDHSEFLRLEPGLPVGIMSGMAYTQKVFEFPSGTTLFMYTDGLSEAEDESGVQFGTDLLPDIVMTESAYENPSAVIDILSDRIRNFSTERLSDDITMLCITSLTGRTLEIQLGYKIEEIARLTENIKSFFDTNNLNDSFNRVMLVAEEAVTNVITHSEPSSESDRVIFRMILKHDVVEIVITDSGPKFNPLVNKPDVDVNLPLECRETGGLGIFLITEIADSCEYEYKDGQNRLTISLKLDKQI